MSRSPFSSFRINRLFSILPWPFNLKMPTLCKLLHNVGSAQSVNLSFLDKGKTYLARIYTDGGDKIKTRTQVKCTRLLVDSSQIMQFALKPGGGAAMQLVPVTDQEIKEYKKYKGQVL